MVVASRARLLRRVLSVILMLVVVQTISSLSCGSSFASTMTSVQNHSSQSIPSGASADRAPVYTMNLDTQNGGVAWSLVGASNSLISTYLPVTQDSAVTTDSSTNFGKVTPIDVADFRLGSAWDAYLKAPLFLSTASGDGYSALSFYTDYGTHVHNCYVRQSYSDWGENTALSWTNPPGWVSGTGTAFVPPSTSSGTWYSASFATTHNPNLYVGFVHPAGSGTYSDIFSMYMRESSTPPSVYFNGPKFYQTASAVYMQSNVPETLALRTQTLSLPPLLAGDRVTITLMSTMANEVDLHFMSGGKVVSSATHAVSVGHTPFSVGTGSSGVFFPLTTVQFTLPAPLTGIDQLEFSGTFTGNFLSTGDGSNYYDTSFGEFFEVGSLQIDRSSDTSAPQVSIISPSASNLAYGQIAPNLVANVWGRYDDYLSARVACNFGSVDTSYAMGYAGSLSYPVLGISMPTQVVNQYMLYSTRYVSTAGNIGSYTFDYGYANGFDLTNPANPVDTADVGLGFQGINLITRGFIDATGNPHFVTATGSSYGTWLSIGSPYTTVSQLALDNFHASVYDPQTMTIFSVGNDNYVLFRAISGLVIVKLTPVSSPSIVSPFFGPSGISGYGGVAVEDIAVTGSTALAVAGGALHIFDISDLSNPRLVVSYQPTNFVAHFVAAKGEYAYVGYYDTSTGLWGIQVVDISMPWAPVAVGTISLGSAICYRLYIDRTRLYVLSGVQYQHLQFSAFSIINPLSVQSVGYLALPYYASYDNFMDMCADPTGQFMYVSTSGKAIQVISLSNFEQLTIDSTHGSPNWATDWGNVQSRHLDLTFTISSPAGDLIAVPLGIIKDVLPPTIAADMLLPDGTYLPNGAIFGLQSGVNGVPTLKIGVTYEPLEGTIDRIDASSVTVTVEGNTFPLTREAPGSAYFYLDNSHSSLDTWNSWSTTWGGHGTGLADGPHLLQFSAATMLADGSRNVQTKILIGSDTTPYDGFTLYKDTTNPNIDPNIPNSFILSGASHGIYYSSPPTYHVVISATTPILKEGDISDETLEAHYSFNGLYLGLLHYTGKSGTDYTFDGSVVSTLWSDPKYGIPDGQFSFTVYAWDSGYNPLTPVTITGIKDTTKPYVTIITPQTTSACYETAPQFQLSISETSPYNIDVKVDGSDYVNVASGLTGTSYADQVPSGLWTAPTCGYGVHFLSFRVTDYAGNVQEVSVQVVKQDSANVLTINSPENSVFGPNAPLYSLSVAHPELLATLWVSGDNGQTRYPLSVTSFDGNLLPLELWSSLSNGTDQLLFHAESIYGRIAEQTASFEVVNKGPVIEIISPVDGDTAGQTAPWVSLSVQDARLDSVFYSLDGGTNKFPVSLGNLYFQVDQTQWDNAYNQTVTIRIYAHNSFGLWSWQDVTLTRSDWVNKAAGTHAERGDGIDFGLFYNMAWQVAVFLVAVFAVVMGTAVYLQKRSDRLAR